MDSIHIIHNFNFLIQSDTPTPPVFTFLTITTFCLFKTYCQLPSDQSLAQYTREEYNRKGEEHNLLLNFENWGLWYAEWSRVYIRKKVPMLILIRKIIKYDLNWKVTFTPERNVLLVKVTSLNFTCFKYYLRTK